LTEQLRLMAVHAHPDDESSKGAATMARYVSEGVDVLVATCTGGERGSVLNPQLQGDPYYEEHIHEVRAREMDEAREILGVRQAWLGYVDSGLPEGDPLPPLPEGCFALADVEEAAGTLVRLIREFRPHVITTYDENGGYPHPDHIMTHKISMLAFDAAGDPERYPDAGEPWSPLKLYYNQGFNKARTVALHEALLARGLESPYGEWLERWKSFDRPERTLTTHVPCADFFEVRDKALLAHRTQIDPDGPWFHVPLEIQKEVWPTEDSELAKSRVDTSLPEDDLFAGVR
jgi:mycothiol S-conjugate amidase